MSSPVSKTIYPMLIIPQSLKEYNFNCNTDRRERIILTFCCIRAYEQIKDQKELFKVISSYVGSRYKEYINEIMKSGINPLDNEEYKTCENFYFTSEEVISAVNQLIDHI